MLMWNLESHFGMLRPFWVKQIQRKYLMILIAHFTEA